MELVHIQGFFWTPVRTKPRREKKLAEYCAANNIIFYLPLKRNVRRYQRRTIEFLVPMFPGYVFCVLNDTYYQKLLLSNSIVYRIKIDEQNETILIEELKSIQHFEEISKEAEIIVHPELVTGTPVMINNGPLKGTRGVVERRKGKTFISINIEILGQSVSTEVDIGDLDADS